ncbi:MAG TPA: Crp/Fnr family transcriptional regulator [Cyclobacteriaceae bacterium]|nr:Crp/Fnr family transcriptional regulator [Cyclobacteriaceae bacterium]
MFEQLLKSISKVVTLTEEESAYCRSCFISQKLGKRQTLLQEGEVCRYTVFVDKGLLRSFIIDDKGTEHILQFAFEGWWMADLYSFLTDEPSLYYMDAIEESELLMIDRIAWEDLLDHVPAMERYFRILIQNNLIATQRRLMGVMSDTAEEKYSKLLQTFPACIQRVPQHMIASYLGMTRETLSRTRGQMAGKK